MKSFTLYPNEVANLTDTIGSWVDIAMDTGQGERTTTQILDAANQGKIQVWLTVDDTGQIVCVTTTEIIDYPNRRVCHIITCTGNPSFKWEDYKEQHEAVEQFAKEMDCSAVMIWGRPGWVRQLPKIGYEQTYVIMEKQLKE